MIDECRKLFSLDGSEWDDSVGPKAFVCFNNDRSLHRADINGKSRCLLRSRRMLISMLGLLLLTNGTAN